MCVARDPPGRCQSTRASPSQAPPRRPLTQAPRSRRNRHSFKDPPWYCLNQLCPQITSGESSVHFLAQRRKGLAKAQRKKTLRNAIALCAFARRPLRTSSFSTRRDRSREKHITDAAAGEIHIWYPGFF